MRYVIEIPEKCSVPAIYSAISRAAGIDPNAVSHWDCTKIHVSTDIHNAYKDYMRSTGQELAVGAIWMAYGPKTSDALHGGEVEVQDGFFELDK